MEHEEIESLLGAYALDAVSDEEAEEITAHLNECPRCRAEVAAHRDVAALLGNVGESAPPDLWARIADELVDQPPKGFPELLGRLREPPSSSVARRWGKLSTGIAAVAAVVVILLGLQIGHLDDQLHRSKSPEAALASGVRDVLSGPHSTIRLVSTSNATVARVVVDKAGDAYWTGSSLRTLPSSSTYQLWAISHGNIVSLGVLGPDPRRDVALRLQHGMSSLMVTKEPEGGTTLPTTAILAKGNV